MLDFYFISNGQTKPNNPELDLEFAGSLDAKTFDNLIKKGVIDSRFDYYSDFRWSEMFLKQIRQTIERRQIQADTDVKQLLSLIDPALMKEIGLMAFGD